VRTVVASFGGSGQLAWRVPADATVTGFGGQTFSGSTTVSLSTAPTTGDPGGVAGLYEEFISYIRVNSADSGFFIPLSHQALEGEFVYFSASGGGIFYLFYEPNLS